MNVKTTFYLALAMAGCVIGYLVFGRDTAPKTYQTPVAADDGVEKPVIAPDALGDVVHVECRMRDHDDAWVFDKVTPENDGPAEWHVTSPFEAKAVGYQVDRIASQLKSLRYEVSYALGGDEPFSLARAGLDPPVAEVTLKDKDGSSRTVQIGTSAGTGQTYVRLPDQDAVRVSTTSLSNLFQDSALEYRDQQLIRFDSVNATRIEITHHPEGKEPKQYVLTRDGAEWRFESPFTGRATPSVESMVQSVSGLRVSKWVSDDPSRLATFGLKAPALTIRITVQTEAPAAAGDDDPDRGGSGHDNGDDTDGGNDNAAPKPRTRTSVYELHVSQRTPIGEPQKVYVRLGDESAVGVILKSTANRLVPIEKQWRDMKLTIVRLDRADRIDLTLPDAQAAFVKEGARWRLEGTEQFGDVDVITALLNTLTGLEARALVAYSDADAATFGLDAPRAVVRVRVPGADEPERFAVGAYTDAQSKRLVYVRHNASNSVAKVRVSSVDPLLRDPSAYRDRTVLRVDGTIQSLRLERENTYRKGRLELTFAREDDAWRMTDPVEADVNESDLDAFAKALSHLKATRFVTDEADPSDFGLDEPKAGVSITYLPPKTYRLEPEQPHASDEPEDANEAPDATEAPDTSGTPDAAAESIGDAQPRENDNENAPAEPPSESGSTEREDADQEPQKLVPIEVQPPAVTVTLAVSEHDGSYYARRTDRPDIYEIPRDIYDRFWVEYHDGALLRFEDSQVRSFTIRDSEGTFTFERTDDGWQYAGEPDLALDRAKVQNLLVQLKDLKTRRYVVFRAKRLAAFGLDDPEAEFAVTLDDGTRTAVLVSKRTCEKDPEGGRYAALSGGSDVFLLSDTTLERYVVDLSTLEAAP